MNLLNNYLKEKYVITFSLLLFPAITLSESYFCTYSFIEGSPKLITIQRQGTEFVKKITRNGKTTQYIQKIGYEDDQSLYLINKPKPEEIGATIALIGKQDGSYSLLYLGVNEHDTSDTYYGRCVAQ